MNSQNLSISDCDVFISYRHVNKSMVKPLVEELERCNIRYFIDWKDVDYGESYSTIISRSISASKVFLLFWTEDVKGSDDIISEVSLAKRRKKIIIPYKIGDFNPDEHDSLIYDLVSRSWYEVPEQTPETIVNVVKRIQRALAEVSLLNSSSSEQAPPEPFSPVQPSGGSRSITDMPPLPEELVRLQSENRALLDAITNVKSFKHESLEQENNAVEQAQQHLDECKKRKYLNWQNMPETMRNSLEKILEENPNCSEESLPFDLENMSNEQYLDFMKQFHSGRNYHNARMKLDNALRQREKKRDELIEQFNQRIQDNKKQEKIVIQRFLDAVLTALLSKMPGYNESTAPYPAEDVINQIPLLNSYELDWKALEINRRAKGLWEARPCIIDFANDEFILGHQYFWGLGKQIDKVEAVKHIQIAAEKGYALAQLELSRCYYHGEGILQDKEEASKWFNISFEEVRKQAQQGDVRAQNLVGDCYRDSFFIDEDKAEAVKWYRMAAEQGDAEAQESLGIAFLFGKGVEEDKLQAVILLRKAAEQGYAWAHFDLGDCYYSGNGVSEDKSEAVYRFRKAAEQGLAEAQVCLGNCYFNGEGVQENKTEAFKWFCKAAEQGLAIAQKCLGDCYSNGNGVPENQSEAVKWYLKAAEQGLAGAQSSLGIHYSVGDGVPVNKSEAANWYRKAAEQGDAFAQFALGVYYFNGDGVPVNKSEAINWLRKAADQGEAFAQDWLGSCYINGDGVPENKSEAVNWYRKAAEQGFANSQLFLGLCYLNGVGVPANYSEGMKWIRKAADQGHEEAKQFIRKNG